MLPALTPEISSKVVAGVLPPCEPTEADRPSSVDNEVPELDGSMGIDARCVSFWMFDTGVTGLLGFDTCELRLPSCDMSDVAQLGVSSAAPFWEAGDVKVGRA